MACLLGYLGWEGHTQTSLCHSGQDMNFLALIQTKVCPAFNKETTVTSSFLTEAATKGGDNPVPHSLQTTVLSQDSWQDWGSAFLRHISESHASTQLQWHGLRNAALAGYKGGISREGAHLIWEDKSHLFSGQSRSTRAGSTCCTGPHSWSQSPPQ